MAKKNTTTAPVAPATDTALGIALTAASGMPTSVRDAGFKFAGALASADSVKDWARNGGIAGYPDNVADEVRDEFKAGLILCYIGTRQGEAIKYHRIAEDSFTAATPDTPEDKTYSVTVQAAMEHTPHQWGKMKADKPGLYSIMRPVYEKAKQFADTRWSRFLKDEGGKQVGAKRNEARVFGEFLKDMGEKMLKRNKVATERGDPSAVNADRLRMEWTKFLKAVTTG